jgi:AcrR family transcriptional regulator
MRSHTPIKKHKKGEITRERILQGAVELFYENGFARTSTRQLVKKAGMSSSAIYNHFENKEEILFTIIQRASDRVVDTLKRVISTYDDPVECLEQMISNMLSLFKDSEIRKEIAIFIDELYQLPEDLREICNRQHRVIFDLYKSKILELKKRKLINPINDIVAAFGILGAMNWVYHWFRNSGALSIEEIAKDLTKLLFNGLMRTDGPAARKQRKVPAKWMIGGRGK